MDLLPVEMKEKVFKFLSSSCLDDIIPEVCSEWETISLKILQSRVDKMLETLSNENLIEIRSRLHPSLQNDNVRILREFERSLLSKTFEIRNRHLSDCGFDADLIKRIWETRGCDCKDVDLCLVRSIHFMPCHQLILVQIPERMDFYSMTSLHQKHVTNKKGSSSSESNLKAYETSVKGYSVKNIWIDNNTHTAVSVYKDLVVSQETTRALILFRVLEVDHESMKIVLENIRRIFLPLWSCAVIMLENKVCTLFTTGTIGVWKMTEDDISVSGNTCASTDMIRSMRVSRFYRLNNLVLVKILSDFDPPVTWTIFDSDCNEEGFALHNIPLKDLVNNSFMDAGEECAEVEDIFVSMNAMVVHCNIVNRADDLWVPVGKIVAKRMSRSPTLEDFISPLSFEQLFCIPDTAPTIVTLRSPLLFTGSLTVSFVPPLIKEIDLVGAGKNSPFLENYNSVVSLLGLQKSTKNNKSKKRRRNELKMMSIELMNI